MRNSKYEDVELEVVFAGICGSDINKLRKGDNIDWECMGHEIVGKIPSRKGYYVVNPFCCNCKCLTCEQTSLMYCVNSKRVGTGRIFKGGFSGKVNVPRASLSKLRCKNPKVGVLIDPAAVVFHALHIAKINKNDEVLILGSGTIGVLYALISANLFKSSNITVLVRSSRKIEILQKIFSEKIKIISETALDEQKKYDKIVEAVGGNQSVTLEMASRYIKNDGKIVVLGAFDEEFSCWSDIRSVFYKQVTVVGVNSYCKKKRDFKRAKSFILKNEKIISNLLTEEYLYKGDVDKNEWIKKCVSDKKTLKGLIVYEK